MSSVLAIRQQRLSRRANHIPTMANIMAEFRSAKFHEHHRLIATLPPPVDVTSGFSDLPSETREAFFNIVYFYQMLVTQIAIGVLDEDIMLAQVRSRLVSIWDASEPYIRAERANNPYGDKHMLSLLEYYANRARELPEASAQAILVRTLRTSAAPNT
ncbi:DUF4760 domain-containing protein [Nocardia sp. CA-129566]|uniref:DUF4760 domain-containing protein n=1 Tax=Nocardia sp. CA-129566 TaxID=3239976 RepID=UPI003D98EB7F